MSLLVKEMNKELRQEFLLFEAKFPKTENVSKTYEINVKPYGSPASKHIGNVTMHAKISYDEVWKVDDKGNKISFVRVENRRQQVHMLVIV